MNNDAKIKLFVGDLQGARNKNCIYWDDLENIRVQL